MAEILTRKSHFNIEKYNHLKMLSFEYYIDFYLIDFTTCYISYISKFNSFYE